jgi:hypothetical protein
MVCSGVVKASSSSAGKHMQHAFLHLVVTQGRGFSKGQGEEHTRTLPYNMQEVGISIKEVEPPPPLENESLHKNTFLHVPRGSELFAYARLLYRHLTKCGDKFSKLTTWDMVMWSLH